MITMGVDSGSLATKGVILGPEKEILSFAIELTGGISKDSGQRVYNQMLEKAKLNENQIDYVVSTGYGRDNLTFSNKNVTEITCHAAGIHFLFPEVTTILDIGGQDSKAINIDQNGQVVDFIMNDKCSAGTGRFLEVIAKALGVKLEELGTLSQHTQNEVKISSMCTVFAETEVVSLVASNTPIPDIVKGVHKSIANRAEILLNKVGIVQPIAMSGGVANNIGMVTELERRLNTTLKIADNPQIVGALGAAIIARKILEKQLKKRAASERRTVPN